jgi:hypothetical protein
MIDLSKYDSQIDAAAAKYGLSPDTLRTFIRIESSGNPKEVSDAGYKGLLQIGDREWKTYGAGGDVFNATDNINAGARMLSDHAKQFEKAMGRAPNDNDLYLIHQQGRAGAVAHVSNPTGKAWENVAEYYPNERVAKSAIWGNLSKEDKAKFGSVDNVTSGDFMNTWKGKVAANGGNVGDIDPVIPPGVTPTMVATTMEPPPADGVPSEQSTNEFDKLLTDLDAHLNEVKAKDQPPAPQQRAALQAPSASMASAAGSALGGVGGPASAAAGGAAAAPVAPPASPPTAPGADPYMLAAMMQRTQPQQGAPAPAAYPGGGNVLALIANPQQAKLDTNSILGMMANGRYKNNILAALNTNGMTPQ